MLGAMHFCSGSKSVSSPWARRFSNCITRWRLILCLFNYPRAMLAVLLERTLIKSCYGRPLETLAGHLGCSAWCLIQLIRSISRPC